jgi:hypothetical protein
VQDSVGGLHICLGRIYFFGEQMGELYVWATIRFAGMSRSTTKDYQAASCQAQDSCHVWIPRTVNKKARTGAASIKFITPKFRLSSQPIVKLESMLAFALLEKLVSTFSDGR